MLESYINLVKGGEGEIVEKKSRFIATIRVVESEEEAVAFIEEMKKKYSVIISGVLVSKLVRFSFE